MQEISLYNTLSRRVEPLQTREPGKVSLYVCGVTPYDALHIGHARAFIVYDALRRVLQTFGYEVTHVQNVTDVDDKIINRAHEVGVSPQQLADRFADEAQVQLAQLNVLPAHQYPRVTGHIDSILELIGGLESKGFAYARGGDVYFDVSKDEDYGKLSGQKPEELESGARIEPGELKDDPLDFALWKGAKPGEPFWESTYGPGRPGWHIECSAMALKILGPNFDIHGGARELVFPHHENEVAQSESYLGSQFARVWWHCGELRVDGKKMSKSLGNFLWVSDALALANANVWRLLFLQTHPTSPLEYTSGRGATSANQSDGLAQSEKLEQARASWSRLNNALLKLPTPNGHHSAADSEAAELFRAKFRDALAADLNTPIALSHVFDAVSDFYRSQDASLAAAARDALESLGFTFDLAPGAGLGELTPRLLDLLISVRQDARERRDFKASDTIRDELKALGIALEDTPDGTRWKLED